MSMTDKIADSLLPIKGLLFDMPKERQEDIVTRKAAVLLAADPGIEGFIALTIAIPEHAAILESESTNAP